MCVIWINKPIKHQIYKRCYLEFERTQSQNILYIYIYKIEDNVRCKSLVHMK